MANQTIPTIIIALVVVFILSSGQVGIGVPSDPPLGEAVLIGMNEIPPAITTASGSCDVWIAGNQLTVRCIHDVQGASAAHIHKGSESINGPIAIDFGEDLRSPIMVTGTLGEDELDDLRNGNLYVNIHSGKYPAGEIRGQITIFEPMNLIK